MSKECEKISKFSGEIFKPPRSFALRLTKATLELRESKRYCACTLFEKRGRGAANKTPIFLFRYAHSCKQTECLKETGKVYTQIVKNCSANELIPILSEFLKESASTRVN